MYSIRCDNLTQAKCSVHQMLITNDPITPKRLLVAMQINILIPLLSPTLNALPRF